MGVVLRLMIAGFALLLGSMFRPMFRPDDPPEDPPQDPPNDDDPPPADDQPYKAFKTKNEYEAAFGPTRLEGRDAERNSWLEELGVKSREEAKRLVTAQREIEQEAETQVEKAQREKREAEEREQTRATEATQAEERRQKFVKRTRLERALEKKGVREDRLERAVGEANLDNLQIDDNDAVTGHDAEAERISKAVPEWFGEVQDEPVPGSRGGSRGGGGGGGGDKKASSRWGDRRYGGQKAS